MLHTRIEYLSSGGRAAPQQIAGIYDFLGRGERGTKTVTRVILSVIAVLAAALLIEWLFVLYTTTARRHVTSTNPDNWSAKIGVLTMRALLDFATIVIFILAALALFFIFLERTAGQRVLLSTYLAAFVIVQVAFLISRFFLAPRASALRFLPFTDETAIYLHRWFIALTTVGSLGTLTCGVVRLAGASELEHFRSMALISLIMATMIIWIILQKRKAAAIVIQPGSAEIQPALPPGAKVAQLRRPRGPLAACFFDYQPNSGLCVRPGDPDPFNGAALFPDGLDSALDPANGLRYGGG